MLERRAISDIPIFHKMYDLYKLLDRYQPSIPKVKRYTLWQKCEASALKILEAVLATGHQKDQERLQTLYGISHELDLLKVFIRLAKEIRAINDDQYLAIQTLLQEIGKMVGGWIKFVPR